MRLQDAQAAPLSPCSKKKSNIEVLLADARRQALQVDCPLPVLPPSFTGAIGERLDLPAGKRRTILVGCGKPADFDREERFWEAAGAAVVDAMRELRVKSA